MHEIKLSPRIIEDVKRRRGGRLRVFDSIDPARTAHLIVDLQNGFMAEGAVLEVPVARDIVPNVNAISRAVRDAGGTNVFIQYVIRDEDLASWSTFYSGFVDRASLPKQRDAFTPGRPGWQLWPGLDVADADVKVEKSRFSAFIPGTCDLHQVLQARGIDTLIITGTVTNCCCESTARDAMQMNYRVFFVADGNAAQTDDAHNATLASLLGLYADVATTEEIVSLLNPARTETKPVAESLPMRGKAGAHV